MQKSLPKLVSVTALTLLLVGFFVAPSSSFAAAQCPDGSPAPGGNTANCLTGPSGTGSSTGGATDSTVPNQQTTGTNQFGSGNTCADTGVGIGGNNKICGTNGQALLGNYVRLLFNWGTGLISAVAFLMLIASGYIYMTSGGNPKRVDTAKSMMTGAVSGVILVIFAWVILYAINPTGTFGG